MIFADKLQTIRKSKGITQEELAEKLNLSRQAITKWESGITYPDITNLILLSDFFHITIDYLVKDSDCSRNVRKNINIDLQKLISFRIEAIRNSYAGNAECCESSRTGSHDYVYERDKYKYYDTWLGGEKFSGEEAVWKENVPVFSMNYFGRILDERFSGEFLKEALRNATLEMFYRGPELYKDGEFTYKNSAVGDSGWFQGYEEIYCHDDKVYECFYHGGIL